MFRRHLNDNPDLVNVSIVDGKLWLSETALRDIALFSGEPVDSDDPGEVLRALGDACERLRASAQQVDRGDPLLERKFVGWGVLGSIAHAIRTKLHGEDVAGPWPPQQADGREIDWVETFLQPAPRLQ